MVVGVDEMAQKQSTNKNQIWFEKKKKNSKKKANQRENRKTKSSTQQRERKHGILAKIVIVKRTGAPQKGGAKNN